MSDAGTWFRFALAALAVWRLTHLLAAEDGPWDLILRARRALGDTIWGKMLDCFNCLSLWIAAPTALFVSQQLLGWLFSWLALSGAACLLERVGSDPVIIHTATQAVEGDVSDGMLRSEESVAPQPPGANQNAGTGRFS